MTELSSEKVLAIDELARRVVELKGEGRTVVHCHGVFDLLHIGHLRHFEQARGFGDALVVTLTPDRYVNKGDHRPAFPEAMRAEMLASLSAVDYVCINEWPTAVETILKVRPDVYCKGGEYKQDQVDAQTNMHPELVACTDAGARVEYTSDVVFSSSELLNRHFSPFPQETNAWLAAFKGRTSAEEAVGFVKAMRELKVLVVGEAIVDDYVFCDTIGKSTKDPVIASLRCYEEAFAGGTLAIANHLSGFCDDVALITCLGTEESHEDFARQQLADAVKPSFVYKPGPTIQKRRFVDRYSNNKLFELYVMDDHLLSGDSEDQLLAVLGEQIDKYDVVIVADYGHGMMTPKAVELICGGPAFLAVNTQSNAGNRGFNTISKYRRADYVCLANHEIAIETRMRDRDLGDLLVEVSQRIDCRKFTVTRGSEGSLHYDAELGFTEVPAFATRATDRVGAGDAVLAVTSLLACQSAPWDVVGFLGNVAGAQMVTQLGNREPISPIALTKSLISLLK